MRLFPTPLLLLALLPAATTLLAQAPHPLTPADEQKIDSLIHQMTLDQKLDYIGGTGFAVRAVPSLGLPAFEMSDGPYGTRSNLGFPSTTYAAGIGLAASWDRELAARVGAGIGRDARARGVHYMLGPGVNIYRSPRNGRNFEYFGEDPFLSANIAVGYITGMQQQGVSSTIKHFLGNNSEYLRHDSDSRIGDRALREIYLPAFEAGVRKAHVGAIMDSYNLINGLHATQNTTSNIDIVRKEWHYPGVVMSDWVATYDAIGAANGGLDIEMPVGTFMNKANLAPAIKSGKVTEAVIDEKIRHLLATPMAFGWLDRPQTDIDISYFDAQNKQAALDSAREGAVLLKNEGSLLPLDRAQLKTILVVGPNAWPGVAVGGGSAGVVPFHVVSPMEGITAAAGPSVNVLYDPGLPTLSHLAYETAFLTAPTGGKPGLSVEYFPNKDLAGPSKSSEVVEHLDTTGMSLSSAVDVPGALLGLLTAKPKSISRRFTGYYLAPKAGEYLLILEGAGEGSRNRVTLDGKLVIDNWDLVRAFQPSISVELTAGPHKVVVEDAQDGLFGGHLLFAIADPATIVSPRALQLAAKADAVVVTAGFDHASEGEGGDRTFALPYGQDQLIAAIAAANPKTIVTLTSGGNVDSNAWVSKVPVLLETWYAGQEGGTALGEILFGVTNPSGHLPATFERRAEDNPTFPNYYPAAGSIQVEYKEGIFVGYRGYQHANIKPLFPFGYGLSYTTFKFANLSVTPVSAGSNPRVTVAFDVTNTGQRSGAEVAQVYVSEVNPSVPRPTRELKGFDRLQLVPGATGRVSVTLDARSFAFWDADKKKWSIDPGKFTIEVGDSVESLPLDGSVELTPEAATSTAF